MPVSFPSSDDEPLRLPPVVDERQPDLVERITAGLRERPRVVVKASTDRDRRRTIAAGKVAGKQLNRIVSATATEEGVLIAFDDADEASAPEPPPPRIRSATAAGTPSGASAPQPPGSLPRRVPGAGPRPGPRPSR